MDENGRIQKPEEKHGEDSNLNYPWLTLARWLIEVPDLMRFDAFSALAMELGWKWSTPALACYQALAAKGFKTPVEQRENKRERVNPPTIPP
jgi:hypothetical protein